jgi:LPPG:FO 2-phospho-L-lactate transferase
MMQELGLVKAHATIAEHYGDVLDGFVLDLADEESSKAVNLPTLCTRTLMRTLADREGLAREVLMFAQRLAVETNA